MSTLRKLMEPDNAREVPRFALGLAIGVARVILHPFIQEQQERVKHVSEAAIHYWRSDAPE